METIQQQETAAQRKHRKEVQEDCPWTSEHPRDKGARKGTRDKKERRKDRQQRIKSSVFTGLLRPYATSRRVTDDPDTSDQM